MSALLSLFRDSVFGTVLALLHHAKVQDSPADWRHDGRRGTLHSLLQLRLTLLRQLARFGACSTDGVGNAIP